jgi:Flp pilus assembly protein TadB
MRHHQESSERAHWPGHRAAARGEQAHLVTEARESRSAEIGQRERRYLVMMGIRVLCFVVTVVMFLTHAGWLTVIPAVGAIALPYFAVVVANARRQTAPSGFRPYRPNLPERYVPPGGEPGSGAS